MKSEMMSALTPALSPQERGNRSPRMSHAMCRVVVRLTANDTESVTAMEIERFPAP
jgi:hypothetical protein